MDTLFCGLLLFSRLYPLLSFFLAQIVPGLATSTWFPCFCNRFPSLFSTFLLSDTERCSRFILFFPAPALQSVQGTLVFIGEYLETKIWKLGVLIATEVSLSPRLSVDRTGTSKCMYIQPHLAHLHPFLYISLCLYIKNPRAHRSQIHSSLRHPHLSFLSLTTRNVAFITHNIFTYLFKIIIHIVSEILTYTCVRN